MELKIAGSNPAEVVGFFGAKKSTPCLPSEGSKAFFSISQICGM
jgi:hypothetical protein